MNYYMNNYPVYNSNRPRRQNDRLVGGAFLGPFLLGGITGGILAPAFYPRPYNNYYYPPNYYAPYPYYPYR